MVLPIDAESIPLVVGDQVAAHVRQGCDDRRRNNGSELVAAAEVAGKDT